MAIADYMHKHGPLLRAASRQLSAAPTQLKNEALLAIAKTIELRRHDIQAANAADMAAGRNNQLESALLDRLELTPDRIDGMIEGVHQIAALKDPVGEVTDLAYRHRAFKLGRCAYL